MESVTFFEFFELWSFLINTYRIPGAKSTLSVGTYPAVDLSRSTWNLVDARSLNCKQMMISKNVDVWVRIWQFIPIWNVAAAAVPIHWGQQLFSNSMWSLSLGCLSSEQSPINRQFRPPGCRLVVLRMLAWRLQKAHPRKLKQYRGNAMHLNRRHTDIGGCPRSSGWRLTSFCQVCVQSLRIIIHNWLPACPEYAWWNHGD